MDLVLLPPSDGAPHMTATPGCCEINFMGSSPAIRLVQVKGQPPISSIFRRGQPQPPIYYDLGQNDSLNRDPVLELADMSQVRQGRMKNSMFFRNMMHGEEDMWGCEVWVEKLKMEMELLRHVKGSYYPKDTFSECREIPWKRKMRGRKTFES